MPLSRLIRGALVSALQKHSCLQVLNYFASTSYRYLTGQEFDTPSTISRASSFQALLHLHDMVRIPRLT